MVQFPKYKLHCLWNQGTIFKYDKQSDYGHQDITCKFQLLILKAVTHIPNGFPKP